MQLVIIKQHINVTYIYIHLRELMMNRLLNNFEETKQIFISKSQSGWALTVDSQWHLSVEGDIRDIDHQY